MKRWNSKKGDTIENAKIDNFLKEIISLYEKYQLGLSHEDSYGAFLVVNLDQADPEWLLNANDNTE